MKLRVCSFLSATGFVDKNDALEVKWMGGMDFRSAIESRVPITIGPAVQ